MGRFYRNLTQNVDSAVGVEFYARIATDTNIPTEDVQKYLLATNDFGKGMQDDINLFVTCDRLNNANFRQKLDLIENNIFRRQNPLELVFKDISTFDAQNQIVGLLLKELDLGEKDVASTLIKKTPSTVDVEIQSRLIALKNNPTFFNSNNNNNKNLPPPSPFQPPSFNHHHFFNHHNHLHLEHHLQHLHSFNRHPHLYKIISQKQKQQQRHLVNLQLKKNSKKAKNLQLQIYNVLSEIPEPPKLELGDPLLNILSTEPHDIL